MAFFFVFLMGSYCYPGSGRLFVNLVSINTSFLFSFSFFVLVFAPCKNSRSCCGLEGKNKK